MTLKKYHQKRNFKKTPEPRGRKKAIGRKNLFVIQKHAASHLHYDFRLELNHVLKSWAVPKGPSLDPRVKRLAVHVEDHPLEYGSFQGIIPKGQYGGGTVMLWDKGEWQLSNTKLSKLTANQAYEKGDLTFRLKGKKLKGLWKLIRIKSDPKNWLLMKVDDEYAVPAEDYDITEAEPFSVENHLSMDAIAEHPDQVLGETRHKTSAKKNIVKKPIKKNLAKLSGIKKAKMPPMISLQLATLVSKAPEGENWLHEIKFDGYRLVCYVQEGIVKLITRGKQNWTSKFPHIVRAIENLKLNNAILDGEIVALDENQHSNFQLLQNKINANADESLIYYLFDIIYYDEFDLSNVALIERKKILQKIISDHHLPLYYSDHVIGDGQQVLEKACEMHLEGIISKEINSSYTQRRSKNWLKAKCIQRQEFIIGGFTQPEGKGEYFGALLLGYFQNKELYYCGRVGTGFTEKNLKWIADLLQKHKTSRMPFKQPPPDIKHVTWVKPNLIAEVEFSEWTQDDLLRTPSFKGLRADKSPTQITKELPQDDHAMPIKKKNVKTKKSNSSLSFQLTHPDRILYPEKKITKLDLATFYSNIHEWILPYITYRPLTLVRCPEEDLKKCFYQKHLTDLPDGLYPIDIGEHHKKEQYFYIKDNVGLMALVQMGVIEIHPWGSQVDDIDKPDIITFDLDPGPNVEWKRVIEAAKLLRELLEEINLQSFVKTTGGKGLHVVVPIKRLYTWSDIKKFSQTFAAIVVSHYPDEFIGSMTKSKRVGKIYLDYLRNQRGATAIAPYSTRARANASVATPLAWDELTVRITSDYFTVLNLSKRLEKLKKDPWDAFFKVQQTLRFAK